MLRRTKQKLGGIGWTFPQAVFVRFGDTISRKLIWINDSSGSNTEEVKISVITVVSTGDARGRDANPRDQVQRASRTSPDAIVIDIGKGRALYIGFKDNLPIVADGNRE